MPYDTMPDDEDLLNFVEQAGITPPAGFDFAAKQNSANATFDRQTGWHPFVAVNETRVFDAPGPSGSRNVVAVFRGGGRFLDCQGGVLSVSNVLVNGTTTYVQDQDFFLREANALQTGTVYTEIEFRWMIAGLPNLLSITAEWGAVRAGDIPDEVWEACLGYGFYLCYPQLSHFIAGGAGRVSDEKGSADFSSVLQKQAREAKAEFRRQTRLWKRVSM